MEGVYRPGGRADPTACSDCCGSPGMPENPERMTALPKFSSQSRRVNPRARFSCMAGEDQAANLEIGVSWALLSSSGIGSVIQFNSIREFNHHKLLLRYSSTM